MPGRSFTRRVLWLNISSWIWPLKPVWIVGAVIWMPTPQRARELLPSTRAATRAAMGKFTVSRVQPRMNAPGARTYPSAEIEREGGVSSYPRLKTQLQKQGDKGGGL